MNILTHKIKNTHLPPDMCGWGNGYIGLPPEHPWFGKYYSDIQCDVHGGLTYSENHKPKEIPDGNWWIGFDTAHYMDNIFNCPESYVDLEIESLKKQAEEVISTSTT